MYRHLLLVIGVMMSGEIEILDDNEVEQGAEWNEKTPPLDDARGNDDALLDMNLLTDEFKRISKYINEGNRRDLNRLRAIALGFPQEELKARPPARPHCHVYALFQILFCSWRTKQEQFY